MKANLTNPELTEVSNHPDDVNRSSAATAHPRECTLGNDVLPNPEVFSLPTFPFRVGLVHLRRSGFIAPVGGLRPPDQLVTSGMPPLAAGRDLARLQEAA